jgi:CheY-like chemotaxis protein
LILLDLDLPEIHGSEVMINLQADSETMSIPVVIISADALSNQIKKMLKAGAMGYITKPIEIPLFLKMVDKWIEQ